MNTAVIIVGKFDSTVNIKELRRCYEMDLSDIFIFSNSEEKVNNEFKNIFGNKIKLLKTIINDDYHNNEIKKFDKPIQFNQFYQIENAIKYLKNYEKENNFKYDFIMKIRADCYLVDNLFSPNNYFNSKNDILFKDYNNLKNLFQNLNNEDKYYSEVICPSNKIKKHIYTRVNNFMENICTKNLGGQFVINNISFKNIESYLNNLEKFNTEIIKNYFIMVNDFAYFSSRDNFIKVNNFMKILDKLVIVNV